MDDEDRRIERLMPEISKRADSKSEQFWSEFKDEDKLLKPFLIGVEKHEGTEKEKRWKSLVKKIWPQALRPIFEVNEMTAMAKCGLANMLSALGHTPEIDGTLKGCSGNEYVIPVLVDAKERLLVADQTMQSSLMMQWMKAQMPKTFDSFKTTVADFFKYLDIFYEVAKKKPTVYWIHDYKLSQLLSEKAGFSMKRMMKNMASGIGEVMGMTAVEVEKQLVSDDEIKSIIEAFDTSTRTIFESLGEIIYKTLRSPQPPFNVRLAANSFRIPFLPGSLLEMMEMSMLDPKSPSEKRTLIGYAYEMGLLDFWNPPWPDYAMKVANVKRLTSVDMVSKILQGAFNVGHEAREVKALNLSPRKLLKQPLEGLEILEQNGLLEVNKQKETFKLTRNGAEYIKEVEKLPRKHAILKALDWVKGRFQFIFLHLSLSQPQKRKKRKISQL